MEKELETLGLNRNEVKVYLAALALGPSSASQLADNTHIKRPTVYLALENLMIQGVVSESFNNKKRLFQAAKPEKLHALTKRMRRQVIDAELMLDSIMPELLKIPRLHGEEPQVVFYPGVEGLKNVALEVSACLTSWYFFGAGSKILEMLTSHKRMDILEDSWALRKNPDRPKIYLITDSGVLSFGGDWKKTKTPWREMKILPDTVKSGSGFIIYEDKLAVLNIENKPFAAVIKSKEVVDVVKLMFQLIWKSLP